MELQQHGLRNVSTTTNQPIFKLRPLSPSTPAEARAFWDQGGSKSSARPWTPAFAARIGGMSLAGIGCFVCAHALPARTRHWWSTEGASDGWRLCSQGLLPHAPGVRGRVLRSSRAPRRNSISLPQHIGRRHVRIARRLGGKAHRLLRLAPRCAALAVCLPLALPFARPRQRPRAPRRQLRLEEDDFDAEAESEASAKRRGGGGVCPLRSQRVCMSARGTSAQRGIDARLSAELVRISGYHSGASGGFVPSRCPLGHRPAGRGRG